MLCFLCGHRRQAIWEDRDQAGTRLIKGTRLVQEQFWSGVCVLETARTAGLRIKLQNLLSTMGLAPMSVCIGGVD